MFFVSPTNIKHTGGRGLQNLEAIGGCGWGGRGCCEWGRLGVGEWYVGGGEWARVGVGGSGVYEGWERAKSGGWAEIGPAAGVD